MMSSDPRARALAALTQTLVTELKLVDALHRVADIAMESIPSASVAGITMLGSSGQPTTAIYTDETSPSIDESQYESGRGPCLDAWHNRRVVRIDDMEAAEATYPEFAASARAHGIHSTLSLPLLTGNAATGALNLYAEERGSFTEADERLGMDLAATAAVVLANASAYWEAFDLSQHLDEAMKSRAMIEQAKGMLMAQSEAMSADDAFDILKRASQRENVKIREIAQRIVNRQPLHGNARP
jgi:transcriptional regulator with GAF, ATPase, and Fis domain